MLGLTDGQMDMLGNAASLLPVERRDQFVRAVSDILCTPPKFYAPADHQVNAAIQTVLGRLGVATGRAIIGQQHRPKITRSNRHVDSH